MPFSFRFGMMTKQLGILKEDKRRASYVTFLSPYTVFEFPLSFPINPDQVITQISFVHVFHRTIPPITSYWNLAFQEWHFAILLHASTWLDVWTVLFLLGILCYTDHALREIEEFFFKKKYEVFIGIISCLLNWHYRARTDILQICTV